MVNPTLVLLLVTIFTLKWIVLAENTVDVTKVKSVYEFTAEDMKGNDIPLDKYKGHVLIIVNIATPCIFSDREFAGLNELHKRYAESKGLRILAFPCHQFLGSEPGTKMEIAEFATKYRIKYDIFYKIDVNGENTPPFYKYLKYKQPRPEANDSILWNFEKFIIDKNGQVVGRYSAKTSSIVLEPVLKKYF